MGGRKAQAPRGRRRALELPFLTSPLAPAAGGAPAAAGAESAAKAEAGRSQKRANAGPGGRRVSSPAVTEAEGAAATALKAKRARTVGGGGGDRAQKSAGAAGLAVPAAGLAAPGAGAAASAASPAAASDVSEKKTVHIRDVPVTATPDDIRAAVSKFGEIVYVRKVQRSADEAGNTAFVKFREEAAARAAVEADESFRRQLRTLHAGKPAGDGRRGAAASGAAGAAAVGAAGAATAGGCRLEGLGVTVCGRQVCVSAAVSREELERLRAARETRAAAAAAVRSKNAHLLEVGRIPPGSPAALEMSRKEFAKREGDAKEERQKLANPNYFVNPLRLNIRNIPKSVTQAGLREVIRGFCLRDGETRRKAQQAASADSAAVAVDRVLKRVAIVREVDPETREKGESRGFGYALFTCHDVALRVLHHLNNNVAAFGGKLRPIVSFAVEDSRALRHREKLLKKFVKNSAEEGNGRLKEKSKKHRLYSRGKRQRERARLRRQQAEAQKTSE